ncbi:MAG: 7-cyano-7-deazaguanine synthase QueC [Nitrospirae bacterium]|nr:7-cyano-7-deazaguanine synthase QueC [Nitrospirota bacterium]
MIERRAVVLLSGGIDSTTALAVAKAEGYAVYALTVEYGQRHGVEVEAARRVARALGVREHRVFALDLRAMGGSALTGDLAVPKDRPPEAIAEGIPVTYVPARNTILLALALAWAEVLGAETIVLGANVLDYSGYPDCRPEFLRAFEAMANLATKAAVERRMRIRIEAPLLHLTKAEILRKGVSLGVDYALTHSCYDPTPEGRACGRCDSCLLRKKGFAEAGLLDR